MAQNQQDAQSQRGLALWLLVSLVVVVFGFVWWGVLVHLLFWVGLFYGFFLLKAHHRTVISTTVQFYNTNIRILHVFSKANIKAEMTLWREILICPHNCVITLSTAYDSFQFRR